MYAIGVLLLGAVVHRFRYPLRGVAIAVAATQYVRGDAPGAVVTLRKWGLTKLAERVESR